ncbi:helix-turn-helix domain-containing protein [Secundilactobacillus folii]|uniref:Helix-turn-helix domain-containing protein n=1 Tax=Secundilactobacillus folii TaxID=2678357 RepID=A0A7X3C352_9LACO|nr:helix-turn-helix transcriptional regulator [Secundilactobacillus folii]MTV82542.1 helix-turn-helix domain-containing protein [Secundilactobacillus folii]
MDIDKFVAKRKATHISQVKMCDGICTQSTLSKFESGGHVPSLSILSQLCARIGLTIDDLSDSDGITANQMQSKLDDLEEQIALEDYPEVLAGLKEINDEQLESSRLQMQFYYLRGFLGAVINQPAEKVLYDFSQILNELDESHQTIFTQLVFIGSGVLYNRRKQTDRANFFFQKVETFIRRVQGAHRQPFAHTDVNYLRLLTLVFFTAGYNNSCRRFERSDQLVNLGINICAQYHVTYFLPRLKFLAAENAIEEKQDAAVVERLINEVLAFARINNSQLIQLKAAALNLRYKKREPLVNLIA